MVVYKLSKLINSESGHVMWSRTAFIQIFFNFVVSQLLIKIYDFLKVLANCPVFFRKKIKKFFITLRLHSLFFLTCCFLLFTIGECTFPLAKSRLLNSFCSSASLCCLLLTWVSTSFWDVQIILLLLCASIHLSRNFGILNKNNLCLKLNI